MNTRFIKSFDSSDTYVLIIQELNRRICEYLMKFVPYWYVYSLLIKKIDISVLNKLAQKSQIFMNAPVERGAPGKNY